MRDAIAIENLIHTFTGVRMSVMFQLTWAIKVSNEMAMLYFIVFEFILLKSVAY